jgi:ubiquinone/menaquinone biosynthesis C-methylase UbiE
VHFAIFSWNLQAWIYCLSLVQHAPETGGSGIIPKAWKLLELASSQQHCSRHPLTNRCDFQSSENLIIGLKSVTVKTMDHMRFSAIAHATHRFCNPLSETQITTVLDRLDLISNQRVIDIGCGKAELLVRLVDKYGCFGTGIDINDEFLREAAKRVETSRYPTRIVLLKGTAKEMIEAKPQYDVSVCVGSSQCFGLYRDALNALAAITRPEGLILIGEGYWRRLPDQVYLNFLGATEDELLTHLGNIEAGREAGLMPLHSCVTDENEWDAYEKSYHANVLRYFDSHPVDPDRSAMLERIASWNRHYHLYGRETLGFGLYLFKKPV